MQVVHAREPLPESFTKSVFLAGPTPRNENGASWRPEAVRLLESLGYDGVVFSPEDRGRAGCGITPENYEPQIRWEHEALRRADIIVFWVPRDLTIDLPADLDGATSIDGKDLLRMPAFTTNLEWGEWFDSGRVVLGYPPETPKMGYFRTKANWHGIPVDTALASTLARALSLIGDGALRRLGETCIPIDVWRTESFQRWHAAQSAAGNTLVDARVLWTYRIGHKRERLFFWAIEADMRVAKENRTFKDGIVIGRPDVAGTVLMGPDRGFNTEVAFIREFRPAATTSDGFVHETANGSSWQDLAPAELAAAETVEETGVALTLGRLQGLGERQLLPTLCPHRANVYAARLTQAELDALKSRIGKPRGVAADGERTWIETCTVREILEMSTEGARGLDWGTVGMILFAFYHKT